MASLAPVAGFSLAALERFPAGSPLPEATTASVKQPALPDVIVFSSAPLRILSDLASAGLRQLAALLPRIEQAVQEGSTVSLGYLAKAASTAARQISDGHQALVAEGPDRVAATLQSNGPTDSKQLLRTLARQIGAEAETAEDIPTSEPARTIVRQSGDKPDILLAEHPDRVATPMDRPDPAQSRAPEAASTDAKQLLRILARQIGAEIEPAEDSLTSEPAHTIARQVGTVDRLEPRSPVEPGASPIQRWISEAKHLLRSTGDVLERAEAQLRPLAAVEPTNVAGEPPAAWVLIEIMAAQAQIALAYNAISQSRAAARHSHRSASRAFSLDSLAGATTLFGMLLIVTTLWIVGGLWSAATGIVALCGAAIWVWRISQASRGVTLDAQR